MSIVNFAIPKTLEKRIYTTLREKGFASKAEFFRFAAIYFIDAISKTNNEEERFNYLTQAITEEIQKKYKNKKLPSLPEQLADL